MGARAGETRAFNWLQAEWPNFTFFTEACGTSFFNLVLTNPQAAPPGAIPRGMEVEGLYAEDGGRSCLSLLSQDVFGHFELCRFLRVNIFWHYGISVGHSPLRRTCLTLCSGRHRQWPLLHMQVSEKRSDASRTHTFPCWPTGQT